MCHLANIEIVQHLGVPPPLPAAIFSVPRVKLHLLTLDGDLTFISNCVSQ